MNTREILGAFAQIQPMQALAAAAEHAAAPIHLQGLAGSGFALATASLYASSSRPIVAILHNKEEAQYFKSDLENLLVGETIYFLPDSFLKPYNLARENAMGVQERIETLNALRRNNKRIFVTYTSALAEFVVDKAELEKSSIEIARGQSLDTEFLMEFLQVNGFERRDFIFEPGEFSVRGGIVDLFSFAHEYPFRIDLDGDIIESIRTFDVNDQLSLKEIAHFSLLPNIQEQRNQETTFSITDYFDPKTIVVAQDMAFQIEDLAKAWEKALQVHQEAVDFGREVIPKHPKQIWNTPKGFVAVLDPFTQIHFSGNRPTGKVDIIEFYQQPQPLFKRNFPMLIDWMQQNEKDGYKTLVFSENSRQIERLTTILADTNAQATFDPVYQGLSAGFVDRDVKIAFATEHQLFDKYYRPKGRQKYHPKHRSHSENSRT
jgi:transcription-repair coupling factor (superfamily II helicase)